MLPDFKTYDKAMVIKTLTREQVNRSTEQNREFKNTLTFFTFY